MKVIHPNTQSTLLMNEQCPFIAEIETHENSDEIFYRAVQIGEVGYSGSLNITRDDWEGFKALVAEIDREWA
jgi:hypothetical protein